MIYSVVLNSNLKASGTNSNAMYYFDWSILQNSKYKMTAVFSSGLADMTSLADIAMLEVQLGQSTVYSVNATQTRASTTNCIGFLIPNATTTSTFMYGDITTIPPLYLSNRPNTNDFSVKIMTNDLPPVLWDDYAGLQLLDYVLILTFESISE
jgi:hypothetical protein